MANEPAVQITEIAASTLLIPIRGTTPLIVHRFDEKNKKIMLDNMQGRKSPKVAKDPQAEFERSMYRLKSGDYGFPAIAFKSATIGGARFYSGVTMTELRQYMFFRGEPGDDGRPMVRIHGEPEMREDVVRVSRGGTDLRYRAQFTEWTATLEVTYVTSALTEGSMLSLINAGGMGVGVGEWRPEKRGDFGTYEVDDTQKIEVIK